MATAASGNTYYTCQCARVSGKFQMHKPDTHHVVLLLIYQQMSCHSILSFKNNDYISLNLSTYCFIQESTVIGHLH